MNADHCVEWVKRHCGEREMISIQKAVKATRAINEGDKMVKDFM